MTSVLRQPPSGIAPNQDQLLLFLRQLYDTVVGNSVTSDGGLGVQINHTGFESESDPAMVVQPRGATSLALLVKNTSGATMLSSLGSTSAQAKGEGAVLGNIIVAGTPAGGDLGGTYPNPTLGQTILKVGIIWMWNGTAGQQPSRFAICDGTGGTPDLRGRFIVGVGTNGGGGATYTLGGTGGPLAGTINIAHDHTIAHTHTITHTHTGPSHSHGGATGGMSGGLNQQIENSGTDNFRIYGGTAHTHTISADGTGSTSGSSSADTGGVSSANSGAALSSTQDIRPAYYGLYYIQYTG